ncbi:hypothetical protein [Catenuloplanes atrovinosus]|uniref:Uncharacterized protein n=1 Tax=Catenuloplanes atrovinosus TaxID=137266 RepID=A0AAE4CB37_9ACTN|nr:hypothetical protein [Catenuloplanes atrovinosus]MDR7277693.1 hypothetical protein [Catenuloplanes atrovinosus]
MIGASHTAAEAALQTAAGIPAAGVRGRAADGAARGPAAAGGVRQRTGQPHDGAPAPGHTKAAWKGVLRAVVVVVLVCHVAVTTCCPPAAARLVPGRPADVGEPVPGPGRCDAAAVRQITRRQQAAASVLAGVGAVPVPGRPPLGVLAFGHLVDAAMLAHQSGCVRPAPALPWPAGGTFGTASPPLLIRPGPAPGPQPRTQR